MNFEWDERKSKANLRKHGFDFADAWEILEESMLTALDDRTEYGEDRWIGIGMLRTRVVVVVFAERAEDRIRIISLRKAYTHERIRYEEILKNRLEES